LSNGYTKNDRAVLHFGSMLLWMLLLVGYPPGSLGVKMEVAVRAS
jgi:hypothetical protein